MNYSVEKEKVIHAGIRLVEIGLIARTWGNVSCRIDADHFVITPSGRDYHNLTPDQIVKVNVNDLSYEGDIKPSGEKGVHAMIYKSRPEVQFIIHTHQEAASILGAGSKRFYPVSKSRLLGNGICSAEYGLPGTKKLIKNIQKALYKTTGNAILMQNHGAVCFGLNENEAFETAIELENTCKQILFQMLKGEKGFKGQSWNELTEFSTDIKDKNMYSLFPSQYAASVIKEEGGLYFYDGKENEGKKTKITEKKLEEFYSSIFDKRPELNAILFSSKDEIKALSEIKGPFYPFVDDYAQIIGNKIQVAKDDKDVAVALQNNSAVYLPGQGAFCVGANIGDANAVEMILEKNAKTYLFQSMFGKRKGINSLESILMRFVYLKKYSKQITQSTTSK